MLTLLQVYFLLMSDKYEHLHLKCIKNAKHSSVLTTKRFVYNHNTSKYFLKCNTPVKITHRTFTMYTRK